MNNLRVGIIGTISTGKTTLAIELNKVLNIPLIEESARLLYEKEKEKNPNFDRNNPEWQFDFQTRLYTDKITKELMNFDIGFVSDRTYLDNFMYFLHYCHSFVKNKDLCSRIEEINRLAMCNYTHIFFLGLDTIPFVNDDVRIETYTGALFFETSLIGLIERWGIETIVIPFDTLEKRVNYIKRKLGLIKEYEAPGVNVREVD